MAPLRQADDAVVVDNSDLTLEEQFNFLVSLARTRMEDRIDGPIALHLHRVAFLLQDATLASTLPDFKPPSPAFLDGPHDVVDSVMATLTMEQRMAQLADGAHLCQNRHGNGWAEAERWTERFRVGRRDLHARRANLQRVRTKRLARQGLRCR